MSWIIKCNANPFLIQLYNTNSPNKTIAKNAKLTAALDGILECVLQAKVAGQSSAETTLNHYSLNPKHTAKIRSLVHMIWGFTVREIGKDTFATYSKHGDFPETKIRAKLQITWPGSDMATCNFAVFQPLRHFFTDVTLVCGDKRFDAHKLLLAARSEQMKVMLTSCFKEGHALEIPLQVPPEAFEAFLEFLYGDRCDLSGRSIEFVEKILELATFFLVRDIKEAAVCALASAITQETLPRITQLASRIDCKELAMICSWKSTAVNIESPCRYIEGFTVDGRAIEEIETILSVNSIIRNPKVQEECIKALISLRSEETEDQIIRLANKYALTLLLQDSMDTSN